MIPARWNDAIGCYTLDLYRYELSGRNGDEWLYCDDHSTGRDRWTDLRDGSDVPAETLADLTIIAADGARAGERLR